MSFEVLSFAFYVYSDSICLCHPVHLICQEINHLYSAELIFLTVYSPFIHYSIP